MLIRVVVVDDHELVRLALGRALGAVPEMAVVGTAGSLGDALTVLAQVAPDVALVDLRLGRERAVDRMGELRDASPRTRLLAFTGWPTGNELEATLAAGARGMLSKRQRLDELVDGVRRVHSGEVVICPELVPALIQRATVRSDDDLDPREIRVLELLAEAQATTEIASQLCLSEHTVRNRIQGLMTKLGVHTRAEAVAEAFRRGLVLPVEPELPSAV